MENIYVKVWQWIFYCHIYILLEYTETVESSSIHILKANTIPLSNYTFREFFNKTLAKCEPLRENFSLYKLKMDTSRYIKNNWKQGLGEIVVLLCL